MSSMQGDELFVDVGRRVGGGSFWIYWLREELLPAD
jgi:hypothetical protein